MRLTTLELNVLKAAFKNMEWVYYESEETADDDFCGWEGDELDTREIAKELGKKPASVKGALGSLCEKGAMKIEIGKRGYSNSYVGFKCIVLREYGLVK